MQTVKLISGMALWLAGCNKCVNASFSYDLQRVISPANNLFRVGDTLTFEYCLPKCGFEHIRQRNVCMESIRQPFVRVAISKIDTIPPTLTQGSVLSTEVDAPCREVSAQVGDPWPTAGIEQAFGVADWRQHPVLSEPRYYFRVR